MNSALYWAVCFENTNPPTTHSIQWNQSVISTFSPLAAVIWLRFEFVPWLSFNQRVWIQSQLMKWSVSSSLVTCFQQPGIAVCNMKSLLFWKTVQETSVVTCIGGVVAGSYPSAARNSCKCPRELPKTETNSLYVLVFLANRASFDARLSASMDPLSFSLYCELSPICLWLFSHSE